MGESRNFDTVLRKELADLPEYNSNMLGRLDTIVRLFLRKEKELIDSAYVKLNVTNNRSYYFISLKEDTSANRSVIFSFLDDYELGYESLSREYPISVNIFSKELIERVKSKSFEKIIL